MKIKRFLFDRHTLELAPLLLILSLLPFLQGGESYIAKIVFLAFPFAYLPLVLLRKRAVYRSFRLIFWAWVIFLLVNLVSTVFSISLTLSIPTFFELLGVSLYFVFFYLIVDRWSDLKLLSFSILVVGFLLSVVSLYFIFSPPVGLPVMNFLYARHGHNHLADYLIFVLPLSMGLYLQQKKKLHTLFSGFLVAFFFISFYLTFARAGFLIVSIITLSLIRFFKPSSGKTAFLLFWGIIPLILIAVFFVVSYSQLSKEFTTTNFYGSRWLWRQVVKPPQHEKRLAYWAQATEGFAMRPIFGNGPGTFRLASRRFQQTPNLYSQFAHNSLLQSASETGGFGLIVFLLLLLLAGSSIKVAGKHSSSTVPLLLGAGGSFIQSLFDFNYSFLAIFLLFWVLIAVLLKLSTKSRHRSSFVAPRLLLFMASLACFFFVVSSIFSSYFLSLAKTAEGVSSRRALFFYQRSALLPSLDIQRFQRFLQFAETHKQRAQVESVESLFILWNKEDPEIFRLLAQTYKPSEMRSYHSLLERAAQFHPLDQTLHHELADLRYQSGDASGAVRSLLESARSFALIEDFDFADAILAYPYPEVLLNRILPRYLQKRPADPTDYYPRLLYELGLDQFETGNYELAELLWKTAISYSLGWSHLHIELASFYAVQEKYDMAQETLDSCLQSYRGRTHCEEVLPFYKEGGDFPPPGYYEEIIRIK